MTFDDPRGGRLDYFPCRYGASKLVMRGPRRRLQGDYFNFLGGTETYGRFMDMPYPALVEHITGTRSVNLGCINAGPGAYLRDKTLLDICRRARATVIQIMGGQNVSNRCYSVHPRRNDRFLRASSLLRSVYPDVDFTEFNFTRHLLSVLEAGPPEKFDMVREELRLAWLARMSNLISAIGGKTILLWLSDRAPGGPEDLTAAQSDPLFVDREMLAELSARGAEVVELVAAAKEIDAGRATMIHGPLERPAAESALGPYVHQRAADAIAQILGEDAET